jgi:hypothetical protein
MNSCWKIHPQGRSLAHQLCDQIEKIIADYETISPPKRNSHILNDSTVSNHSNHNQKKEDDEENSDEFVPVWARNSRKKFLYEEDDDS